MEKTGATAYPLLGGAAGNVTRVVVQHGVLPKYRVPVFFELGEREGIELKVVYDQCTEGPLNCRAQSLRTEHSPLRRLARSRTDMCWHSAQWRYAGRDYCDVLIMEWDLHYASLVPALLRARLNRVPTILWGHGYSKREAVWRSQLRQAVARLATALMFYNCGTARTFIDAGWDSSRIFTALNSLDQAPIRKARQAWANRSADMDAFRRKHDLKLGSTILFVSRLLPENGIHLLLEAAAHLVSERLPNLTVALIGAGPDEKRLKRMISRLGLARHVRMPGAIYDEMALAPWFLSANVFCYPINVGLSLLHAFGYGLPVVTSNNVGAQNPEIEALEDGKNGLLYQDGNPLALAAALDRILTEQDLRKRMSAAALDTVATRFSLPAMVDGMEQAVRFCARKQ